jgi:hypothetical protein
MVMRQLPHQVLRALEDEVPAQVRKSDQRGH